MILQAGQHNPPQKNENHHKHIGTSLVVQLVKNLPAVQETWVRSLGQEDSLEKGMASHSSILAWKIPWTEEPGRLQPMGSHDWATNTHTQACYSLTWFCREQCNIDIKPVHILGCKEQKRPLVKKGKRKEGIKKGKKEFVGKARNQLRICAGRPKSLKQPELKVKIKSEQN